ncbi:Glycosyl transferase family 2 [Rhizobiales bacterium GAS188]|nr:Glycosyl transferase family 2 [Rhizobiales bacterium GAS188]
MSRPLVSVLINNYNYARFLGAAIDSVLHQDYPFIEIVVVDDGSTDDSREIIAGYGDRIVSVLKANGGQGSAFNAGVVASRGEILCFLDADDVFFPGKVARVVEIFSRDDLGSKPVMVHHFMAMMSSADDGLAGRPHGRTHASPLNLYEFAKRYRFLWNEAGPTSALCINRRLADRIFPIPEEGVRISADDFVIGGASLLGELHSVEEKLAGYRIHGNNNWFGTEPAKSDEFLSRYQDYLNAKLIENGKLPVISFKDSIYAWHLLLADKNWFGLFGHMLRLSVRHHDPYTLRFVYHTLMTIAQSVKRSLLGSDISIPSRKMRGKHAGQVSV